MWVVIISPNLKIEIDNSLFQNVIFDLNSDNYYAFILWNFPGDTKRIDNEIIRKFFIQIVYSIGC